MCSAVKLYRAVKPVPLVLRANTVPVPPVPPTDAVPYSVSPDKTNRAFGEAPSLLPELAVKLCSVVKVCAVARPASIKPRPAISPMAKLANTTPLTEQMARGTRGQVDRLESPGARPTP